MTGGLKPFLLGSTVPRRKARGYCADYCSVCHAVRPFAVADVFRVPCLFLVPVGQGEIDRVEKTCTECGNVVVLDGYAVIPTHESPRGLWTLLSTIPQEVRARWEDRTKEDQAVASDPRALLPERRMQRLLEAFADFEPGVARAMSSEADVGRGVWVGKAVISAIVVCLVLFGETMAEWRCVRWLCSVTGADPSSLALLLLVVSGGAIAVYLSETRRQRYLTRHVYPKLASEVALLRPTTNELAGAKEELSRRGYKIAGFSIPRLLRAARRHTTNHP